MQSGPGITEPVSDADWTMSSQDSWYVMVPVTHVQSAVPTSRRGAKKTLPEAKVTHTVTLNWPEIVSMVDTGLQPLASVCIHLSARSAFLIHISAS